MQAPALRFGGAGRLSSARGGERGGVPGTRPPRDTGGPGAAGSPLPEPHEAQACQRVAVGHGAESPSRHQHCSQLVYSGNGRSLQPWRCWRAGPGTGRPSATIHLAFKEPAGRAPAHCRRKGNAGSLLSHPLSPFATPGSQGGRPRVFEFQKRKKSFSVSFFRGTKCFKQCLCPIETPGLATFLSFCSQYSCARVLVRAARCGCMLYRVMN